MRNAVAFFLPRPSCLVPSAKRRGSLHVPYRPQANLIDQKAQKMCRTSKWARVKIVFFGFPNQAKRGAQTAVTQMNVPTWHLGFSLPQRLKPHPGPRIRATANAASPPPWTAETPRAPRAPRAARRACAGRARASRPAPGAARRRSGAKGGGKAAARCAGRGILRLALTVAPGSPLKWVPK